MRRIIPFFFLLLIAACTGDAGDTCQFDEDCNSGLICCPPNATRGVCAVTCDTVDASVPDASLDAGDAESGAVDGDVGCSVGEDGGSGVGCGAGEYCQRDGCAIAGTCLPIPDGCGTLAPVCGCDGVTYLNSCEAATVGTSLASTGECAGDPPDASVDAAIDATIDATVDAAVDAMPDADAGADG
ncbi:MAG: hypothetical protein AAGF12_19570 [Myxococcota bacterium]